MLSKAGRKPVLVTVSSTAVWTQLVGLMTPAPLSHWVLLHDCGVS